MFYCLKNLIFAISLWDAGWWHYRVPAPLSHLFPVNSSVQGRSRWWTFICAGLTVVFFELSVLLAFIFSYEVWFVRPKFIFSFYREIFHLKLPFRSLLCLGQAGIATDLFYRSRFLEGDGVAMLGPSPKSSHITPLLRGPIRKKKSNGRISSSILLCSLFLFLFERCPHFCHQIVLRVSAGFRTFLGALLL